MQPYALATLAERGIDGDAFRATRLDAASLADVDLVLTATRAHRTATVRLAPRLLRSTFTMLQFARLARRIDESVDDGTALVAAVNAARTALRDDPRSDDLLDPIGGPLAGYRRCAAVLDDSIAAMLDAQSKP
ncbi:MAG: hypothetical protein H0X22_08670 [Acidimicrobiia bacterium]|nr:hypothetical protein [Acidimicrobiia bacterium]